MRQPLIKRKEDRLARLWLKTTQASAQARVVFKSQKLVHGRALPIGHIVLVFVAIDGSGRTRPVPPRRG